MVSISDESSRQLQAKRDSRIAIENEFTIVSISDESSRQLQGQTRLHRVEGCRDFLVQFGKRIEMILNPNFRRLAGDDPPLEFRHGPLNTRGIYWVHASK